jgi:sRNA-binding regulator protein Hfq
MKDSSESAAVGRAREPEEFANRKLIRPPVPRESRATEGTPPERRERHSNNAHARKGLPAEQTHAENFYYQKQIQSKTPMVIVLKDGESLQGVIEWYDKSCIKLNRGPHPYMLIYKASIRYMFKQGEDRE